MEDGSTSRLALAVAAAATVLLTVPVAQAEKRVWTCVDANGHKTIQDEPCPETMQAKQPATAPLAGEAPSEPKWKSEFRAFGLKAAGGAALVTALGLAAVLLRRRRGRASRHP